MVVGQLAGWVSDAWIQAFIYGSLTSKFFWTVCTTHTSGGNYFVVGIQISYCMVQWYQDDSWPAGCQMVSEHSCLLVQLFRLSTICGQLPMVSSLWSLLFTLWKSGDCFRVSGIATYIFSETKPAENGHIIVEGEGRQALVNYAQSPPYNSIVIPIPTCCSFQWTCYFWLTSQVNTYFRWLYCRLLKSYI